MNQKRRLGRLVALFVAMAATSACGAQAAGYRAPRTTFGAPDLQGTWNNLSLTQLERPDDTKSLILDEAQAAALEQRIQTMLAGPIGGVGLPDPIFYPRARLARIDGRARSSWLVDPADGKLPFTPQGRAEFERKQAAVLTDFDGPEARDISERCLLPVAAMETPILNINFSANYQIMQTAQDVAIYFEVNHEVRFIRLNGRHPPKDVRYWMGDSIGHWEKDVLVVETTNFRPDESYRLDYMLSADARVIERFRRVSPTELRYSFEVDDPQFYTRVWRGEMPFHATRERMYEDACHEGNYALPNALGIARRLEARPH